VPAGNDNSESGVPDSMIDKLRTHFYKMMSVACMLLVSVAVFADVVIVGVDPAQESNIRAFVGLAKEPCDAEPWRIQRRTRAIESEVQSALEPFGFYASSVETTLLETEACWQATITVNPGPRVLWRNINVEISGTAADDQSFDYRTAATLQSGMPIRHRDYEQYKQTLQVAALDRGYLEAEFTDAQLNIWPDDLSADMSLAFDSGPRYTVGEIKFVQSILEPSLVTRYVDIRQGDPYDSRSFTSAYRDLTNSGYFRRVDISPEFDLASDRQVPVTVKLERADRIEYTIGAGFATDTGPRFRAGYRNRRVNSRGHRINATLRASPVLSGLSGEYRKPLSDPRSDWLSYAGSVDREDTDTSENNRVQVGVRRSKRLNASWIRTLSVDYSYERFTVGGVDDISRLILPSIAFDHKVADRDLYPTSGRRLSIEVRGADESLGSSTSLVQLVARARWITSLSDKTRLMARISAGITGKDALQELPPTLRFFAGGDESVRGFGYETLGPVDANGDVIGGSNLLVAGLEMERHLRGNIYGAVFVDAGNAFNDTDVDPALSTGLGIKWRSPVGPVRIYLGHPLNKSGRSVRLHISLGAEL